MRSLCNAVDPDGDLAALRSTADAAVRTSAALAARQADAFEQVFTELLASPEITRCAGFIWCPCEHDISHWQSACCWLLYVSSSAGFCTRPCALLFQQGSVLLRMWAQVAQDFSCI